MVVEKVEFPNKDKNNWPPKTRDAPPKSENDAQKREENPYNESDTVVIEDVNKTVKIYVENQQIFYLLWDNLKDIYTEIPNTGKRGAEHLIIKKGQKKLYGLLKDNDIKNTLDLYKELRWYYDISKVGKYPKLDLSTIFGERSVEEIFVHVTEKLHGWLWNYSRMLGITIGDLAMIDIFLTFNEAYCKEHFTDHIMDYCIGYKKRIEDVIKNYRIALIRHMIFTIEDMEKDIMIYKLSVEKGIGDPVTLQEKIQLLDKIKSVYMPSDEDKQKDKNRNNDRSNGYAVRYKDNETVK